MKRITKLLAAVVCLICVAGCGALKDTVADYLDITGERGASDAYLESLSHWTREKTAYSQFETRFHISATYRSPAFREAFLKEQSRLLALGPGEKSRHEAVMQEISADFTEFFFYAYTASKEANDFGERHSEWRVFLEDDQGGQISPLEIRKVDKITSGIEFFYPYVQKHYGLCYHLKFPRSSSANLKLVFAGHLGRIDLQWQP